MEHLLLKQVTFVLKYYGNCCLLVVDVTHGVQWCRHWLSSPYIHRKSALEMISYSYIGDFVTRKCVLWKFSEPLCVKRVSLMADFQGRLVLSCVLQQEPYTKFMSLRKIFLSHWMWCGYRSCSCKVWWTTVCYSPAWCPVLWVLLPGSLPAMSRISSSMCNVLSSCCGPVPSMSGTRVPVSHNCWAAATNVGWDVSQCYG